jgi:ribosomal protein S18 acetylase RimI-like enzyme
MHILSRHADSSTASRFLNVAPRQKSMPVIRQLTPDQWPDLRRIRLRALADSPQMFLSSYEQEVNYTSAKWENEFKRGDWYAGYLDGKPICMTGVTKDPEMRPSECYIEYMWVSPEFRRSGIARSLLGEVLSNLRDAGYSSVFLWVLNGNDVAAHLYERMGFAWTGLRQPLANRPGRFEHQMTRSLK